MVLKRFQTVIGEAMGPDPSPYSTPTTAQLGIAAAQLDESDIADILDTMETLSREKDTVPDWDGDTQDDIARAQQLLARLLHMSVDRHGRLIAERLAATDDLTKLHLAEVLRPAAPPD